MRKMMLAKISMKIDSEKKHSVRYDVIETEGVDAALQSIYVMRSSLPNPIPQKINVTIEVEND